MIAIATTALYSLVALAGLTTFTLYLLDRRDAKAHEADVADRNAAVVTCLVCGDELPQHVDIEKLVQAELLPPQQPELPLTFIRRGSYADHAREFPEAGA